MPVKSFFIMILLVAGLAGGLHFADWLVLKLLHVQAPLAWGSWWQYVNVLPSRNMRPMPAR